MRTLQMLVLFLFVGFLAACADDDEEKDPCVDIVCLNGGICNGAGCNCPLGFTGESCEIRQTPTSIEITGIDILSFPNRDERRNHWDSGEGSPDVYFKIINQAQTEFIFEQDPATRFEDIISPGTYEIRPAAPIKLTNVNEWYGYILFDYEDFGADQLMGGISAASFAPEGPFEEIRTITAGVYSFKLYLKYNFN